MVFDSTSEADLTQFLHKWTKRKELKAVNCL